MASNMIGNLAVSLTMNTAAFQKGATLAEQRASSMKSKMDGIGASIAKLGPALALGAVAGGVAVLGSMAKSAFELGSSLTEAASKVGVTVEALQEMRFAATQNGISIETMDGSLNKMTKTLGELALGNKTVADNFKELGMSARDFIGLTPTEAFAKIADALKGIENESVRAALGNKIFGRSYAELKPLVDLGADGINAAAEEKRKDGVISTEQAKTLDDLADGWDKLKDRVGIATAQFIANQAGSANASTGLQNMGNAIGSLINDLGVLITWLNQATVKFHELQKLLAQRTRDSALTRYIPGVAASAQSAINLIEAENQRLTSNGGGRPGVRGGTGRVPTSAKPMVAAPALYVPRVSGGSGKKSRPKSGPTEAEKAAEAHIEKMKTLVASLLVEETAFKKNREQIKSLVDWYNPDAQSMKEHRITAEQLNVALRQLRYNFFGQDGPQIISQDTPLVDNITDSLTKLEDIGKTAAQKLKEYNQSIAKSFKETADDVLGSISGLATSIKSGGLLGILAGVADLFLSLGSAGVFGGKLQANINKAPGRARGGATTSNRTYMVGERGPELFTSNRSGFITPNNKMGGGGRASSIQIIPSPYFNVVVDGRADGRVATAAPGLVTAAAAGVQTNLQQSNFRTLP